MASNRSRLTKNLIIAGYKFKKQHPVLVMTLLVFVIIPVIAGASLGYEMKDDTPTSIPTVMVNHDNSEFSRTFVEIVEDSPYFNIVKHTSQDRDVEEMLRTNKAYAGIIVPQNFYKDLTEGKAPSILTVYDGSSLTVVTTSKTSMSEILLTLKGAYMMKVFEGKQSVVPSQVMGMVNPINVNYKFLFNPTKNFRKYLLIGMLVAVIQVGIAMQGAERGFRQQLDRYGMVEQLKILFGLTILSTLSIILCLGVQYVFFQMPYRGTLSGGLLLTMMFAGATCTFGYLMGRMVPDRVFGIQLSAVLVLPTSILGGYTYPIYGMPAGFAAFAKVLPFYHYGNTIRKLCLGDVEFHHLYGDFRFFAVFIACELVLVGVMDFVGNRRKNGRLAELEVRDLG